MSPSTGVLSTTPTTINSNQEFYLSANILIPYGIVMTLILVFGSVGNVEHMLNTKRKTLLFS